jgi:hypothetical protein
MSTTPPTTENKTAGFIANAIKSLGNSGVKIVEALIIADLPWLGWPGIKQVWQLLLGFVASYFIVAAQNGATFEVIDTQVGGELDALSVALRALIAAQKTGDPVAIKKAIQDYADAHSALVHSDGSHHATS